MENVKGGAVRGAHGRPFKVQQGERPILGPDGQIYTRRPDGTILDADGRILRDASGKSLVAPPGDIVIGSDGRAYFRKPDGSVVDDMGRIFRRTDGSPVRVRDGERLIV